LLELVEEEGGTLDLYTSAAPPTTSALAEAFEEAYGIDVGLYRAGSPQVAQRIVEEAEAGFHGADVLFTNGLRIAEVSRQEVLSPYESPYRDSLPEDAVQSPLWSPVSLARLVISWNTDQVPEEARPTSWEELADPSWRGRLAIDPSDVDWYKTLFEEWTGPGGKSEEEAQRLFEQIAQNAVFVDGHTLQAQLVGAGELDIGINASNVVDNTSADGAPIGWQPVVEPVLTSTTGVAPVEGALHPAAAVLFIDWILSKGQPVFSDTNQTPISLEGDEPAFREVFVDDEALVDVIDEWTERFDELIRLGETFEDSG
jgi:iron(III) transport system substrate-binding protein